MKKVFAICLIAVTMAIAGTAQASSKAELVKFQQKRYSHALGYYKAIWNVARRTVYHPNHEIRRKWQGKARYLKWVQNDAKSEIYKLTAPPLIYLDASNPANNYRIVAPLILQVFGTSAAVEVSRCETGGKFNTNASNGQYKGLFQMGDHERATYGDARDALGEILAAHRYYLAASGWGPWSCKP